MRPIQLLIVLFLFKGFAHAKTFSDTPNIALWPNPAVDWININIQGKTAEKISVQFLNITGQAVKQDSTMIQVGINSLKYSLAGENPGIYFCRIDGSNWTKIQKVVLMQQTPGRSDSLDIVHYDLSLSIRNLASKSIGGTAKITFAARKNGVSQLSLDLLKLHVSAIRLNNITQTFSQTDSTLFVQLSSPQDSGDTFELEIDYNGNPVTDASWGGFYFNGNYAYNMGVGFTSNPHNFGRCWFPCFDNFTDRATYAFHITTDSSFKAVCNGLPLPETVNPDGSITWNWELQQPIPTYLASAAVGKYEFVKYTFTGQNRTYPVIIAAAAADTAKARVSFAKLNSALSCFESKYGVYPFDRVGYVGVPFNSGAMEHATNIAYPIYAINGSTDYETLFAHELSHMWWGDQATCRTAEEMWLNEGWASFNEALFLECVYGKQAYIDDIRKKSVDVLLNAPGDDGGWLPVSGVPHNATYGTHVYKKGALMVHTLRTLMGDSAFFTAARFYMQTYHFKDVSTEDLKQTFQQFTTQDLSAFFQKWIYSKGHSDIVLTSYTEDTKGKHSFGFMELNRENTLVTPELPFAFSIYNGDGKDVHRKLIMKNGVCKWDTTFAIGMPVRGLGINDDYSIQLAHTSQKEAVNSTGSRTYENVLFSFNTQTAGSAGDSLRVVHHWVGPVDVNLRQQGIRISTERYWSVETPSSGPFSAWGFFNYDGIGNHFLDAGLIDRTEDSLVLLYRFKPDNTWRIVTDVTFQPGNNKNDKTGRFWVNNLSQGDYAFGMRDVSVVGLKETKPIAKTGFRIFPNPADSENQVTLEWPNLTYVKELTVTNMQGQVVKHVVINQQRKQYSLDISKLQPGEYIITATLNGNTVSQKFLNK
jgi:aminopeptidase N